MSGQDTLCPHTVAVVTGSRAEFGLLVPVMDAIAAHPGLDLKVVVAGAHFLPPAETWREVAERYPIAARVEMQRPGETGRGADAAAVGRGVSGFAGAFENLRPDWVVVLGDRIEAFAAASAASIAGIAVAHIHGGDRAEGIADEAMRHAITKLAHLHLAATEQSAERILRMGEKPEFVFNVGSPAIDGLERVERMSDEEVVELFGEGFEPHCVILMHPSGLDAWSEKALAEAVIYACDVMARDVLCLAPNSDPGREIIEERLRAMCHATERRDPSLFTYEADPVCVGEHADWESRGDHPPKWLYREHLPRDAFLRLLKRIMATEELEGGALVGNSSAGLIEAAALKVPALNVGPRQAGRETPDTVNTWNKDPSRWRDPKSGTLGMIPSALDFTLGICTDHLPADHHPYGDGHAGERIAQILGRTDPRDPALLRMRCAY